MTAIVIFAETAIFILFVAYTLLNAIGFTTAILLVGYFAGKLFFR